MVKFFTTNLWAKILSVIFAVSLWIYVVGVADKVDQFPTKIPVQVKNLSSDIALVDNIPDLELKVKASYVSWQKLKPEDFEANIDLFGFTVGDYEVEPKISCKNNDVEIIESNPSKIKIKIEEITSKKVPIETKIEGSPREGFVVVDVSYDPEEVEIKGAKSLIEKTYSVHGKIYLNGESGSINRQVDLFSEDSLGNKTNNLNIKPNYIKSQITILESSNAKTVGIKANISGSPNENYWISKVIIDPSTVSIVGDTNLIKNVSYLETEKINISGINSSKTFSVKLILPDGAEVLGNKKEVSIKIYLENQNSSRKIIAGVVYKNGKASTSESLEVLISGPVNNLSSLSSSNVFLEIDVSNKIPGKYKIDIKKEMIKILDNFLIIDYLPKSINIEVY